MPRVYDIMSVACCRREAIHCAKGIVNYDRGVEVANRWSGRDDDGAYWPLNVFSEEDAADQLSILRAIASSDLHNLVYRADYRIVPAVTASRATP